MPYQKVADRDDLWSGEMTCVVVGERKVVLVNIEGAFFAYEDRCAHQGVAISEGRLEGTMLTCSAHHWVYDARSGCGINPSTARLTPLSVRVERHGIYVDV